MDLATIKSHIGNEFISLEEEIQKRVETEVDLINILSKHILSGGGKRLRPTVLLLANKACEKESKKCIGASVVVEFIHAATLLHDDVVDESKVRHGKKTVNDIWGNQGAVLVGDFLYSRAFEIIVEINNPRVYESLAYTTNIISQGEVLQLINLHNPDMKEETYMDIIFKKTAKLFETSAEIGSILAGDNKVNSSSLSEFGLHFGLAYQLRNDFLDYFGSEEITGKNLAEDLSEGKPTLPLIYAIKVAKDSERKLIQNNIIKNNLKDMDDILQILKRNNVKEYLQNKINLETTSAIKSLKRMKDNVCKDSLIQLANYCAERDK